MKLIRKTTIMIVLILVFDRISSNESNNELVLNQQRCPNDINFSYDDSNCGTCGTVCDKYSTCHKGVCVCQFKFIKCGNKCIDPFTNSDFCGDCKTRCKSNEICSNRNCICQNNFTKCDDGCSDLKSDIRNCGKCSNPCGQGFFCKDGVCIVPEGGKVCENRVVFTKTDASNCGECGIKCSSEQTCQSGKCECLTKTQSACNDKCVYFNSDSRNCGKCANICPQDVSCIDSTCFVPKGSLVCDNILKKVTSDFENCGACGKKCVTKQTCSEGKCLCPLNETECPNSCFNLNNDMNNCGGCGKVCIQGTTCVNGTCTPPQGGKICGNSVRMIINDNNNCGDCNIKCSSVQKCTDSKCVCMDSALSLCSGNCLNLSKDINNCGECGRKCPAGQFCIGGICQARYNYRQTGYQYGGNGNIWLLENHSLGCGSNQAIYQFKLERSGDSIQYSYTCIASEFITNDCSVEKTNITEGVILDRDGLEFLNQLNMNCGGQRVIRGFRLNTPWVWLVRRLQYEYTCCRVSVDKSCSSYQTSDTEYKWPRESYYLDRQNVQVTNNDSAFSRLQLSASNYRKRYFFSQCPVL